MARRSSELEPELLRLALENLAMQAQPRAPLAPSPAHRTPESWAAEIKTVARAQGTDLVGITRLSPEWVFEGYTVAATHLVLLGIGMDHARLATAPRSPAAVEVMAVYNACLRAARAVADWLRGEGHDAEGHSGPRAGPVNLVPAALAAGFGELGKHGSILNRQLGSSFRLSCVLTSVPAATDVPDALGADAFCESCRVCTDACPVDAISDSRQLVRGVEKWYVDFDRCLPFFNEHVGCAVCIAACPWSRPGVAPRLADKLGRRRARTA